MRAMTVMASAVAMSVAVYSAGFAADAMPDGVHVMNGMLAGANGMTLYTWDNDKEIDKSACAGNCPMNWPALTAGSDARDMDLWKVITREDGTRQWSYKGKPLYYFHMDSKAGDSTGDGLGLVWYIAKP